MLLHFMQCTIPIDMIQARIGAGAGAGAKENENERTSVPMKNRLLSHCFRSDPLWQTTRIRLYMHMKMNFR